MQLSLNTSLQQSQLDVGQFTLSQQGTTALSTALPASSQDRVELSDEARRSHEREHSVAHLRGADHERQGDLLGDFLKSVLQQITGAKVNDLQSTTAMGDIPPALSQDQQAAVAAQQANLSFESDSLSINGSINTADGFRVSFALDLQIMHATASTSAFSLDTDPNGYEFNFAGSSAELSSTSFNFSLSADAQDGTPVGAGGLGNFSPKDDLKEVRQVLKPLLKDFLHDVGMPSDRRNVNRLLHAIA